MKQVNMILPVEGMSCAHCELTIEEALQKLKGISNCKASFGKGQVIVSFDDSITTLKEIKSAISNAGYECVEKEEKSQGEKGQILYILIILLGGYVILKHLGVLNIFNFFPTIQSNAGYGMLFLIGLLTSLHCVAMCGGINLAQSVNSSDKVSSPFVPNILYNLGRVISYTIVGGIVGGVGAAVNPGGGFRGIVAVFAGVFMIIMGLNMLNIFPWLRRFNLRMPKFISKRINKKKHTSKSSLYIGLLNGLMPCGPLQSMQLYALSTGSILTGALSMFLFSLGTVPLMFILGALSSKINKKFTEKMLSICAILVVILGVGMLNNGLALSGVAMPSITNSQSTANEAIVSKDIQTITTPLDYGRYPALVVKNNIPVKWTITAKKGVINGCNNEIIIPEYDLVVQLKEGDNIIEFIPTKTGTFSYSCWMGMIRSSITVTD
ncbi:MAG: heavy metal transporter [Anaerocolumna sp.]|jgi:copper ion binding protein|nr:heavy metal transporter [Anaerocolumna sp.]